MLYDIDYQEFILKMFKDYMSGQSIKAEFEELIEKLDMSQTKSYTFNLYPPSNKSLKSYGSYLSYMVAIGIQEETKKQLGLYGRSYESYDTIIKRLIAKTTLRPLKINTKTEAEHHE